MRNLAPGWQNEGHHLPLGLVLEEVPEHSLILQVVLTDPLQPTFDEAKAGESLPRRRFGG